MNPVHRHRLSTASFATLARGEGSAEITRDFWASEESRRLLLVSTLIGEIGERPGVLGPLDPVDVVLKVLSEAQRTAPEAVRDILMEPGVGSGCAYALRRLRGGAQSTAPLFVDLGVVHALALTAVARSGLTWSTRLPVRAGHVMLHTYGLARFPSAAEGATVEASADDGRIRLSGGSHEVVVPADRSDRPGWSALRRIEVGGHLPLSVWVDDLDPLRDLGDPVAPQRLDDEAFARWRALIEGAWTLLCRDYPADAAAMAGGLVSIVPLKHLPGWDTRSASNGEAFGGVMISEPPDVVTTAVSLIHEYQHIKLGALLHLIPLTKQDDGSLYYAPWRDDPRPLGGLIQGIYAFFGIARFWRTRLDNVDDDLAAFEYAYALQQTAESVHIGLSAPGLTEDGCRLLDGLREQIEQWLAEPAAVHPRIERLAQLTADSHRLGWRLRHFQPSADEVTMLAGLLQRREPPRKASLAPAIANSHPELRWRQRIPAAARKWAVTGAASAHDDISAAENALLAQDAPAAQEAFERVLERLGPHERTAVDHDEARAWAGLAMSLPAGADESAVLHQRPDLVRALCTTPAARDATPVDIARWLAPALR